MAAPVRPGDVVLGKYRIESPLGAGGMGVVMRAMHLQLHQPVALKFLVVRTPLEAEVAIERFLREARATFRLRSEHTVRVMDVGTLLTGEPFIVMELLEGKDLKDLLAAEGPLDPRVAADYMAQVCDSLAEAHAIGIVHRDLKSRNLFLTHRVDGTPCIKVLDFGLSKVADEAEGEDGPLTRPDQAMGSPRYMAPEQWQSAATVDARADVYGAGVVLYELLTGQLPLAGLPLGELIRRLMAGAIPSPKELRPDLSDELARVVLKAMRPHPEERYASAAHLGEALRSAFPVAAARPRPPRMSFARTAPTAVVDQEALLARAQLSAALGSSGADAPPPTTDPAPTPLMVPSPYAHDGPDVPPSVHATSPLAASVPTPEQRQSWQPDGFDDPNMATKVSRVQIPEHVAQMAQRPVHQGAGTLVSQQGPPPAVERASHPMAYAAPAQRGTPVPQRSTYAPQRPLSPPTPPRRSTTRVVFWVALVVACFALGGAAALALRYLG